jgi:hypothetical protein
MSWYTASNSNDSQGLVIDLETGKNIAVTYEAENAPIVAASPKMLDALHKAEQRIEQLCDIVNTLAGFRKVRADDFAEEIREAIRKATEQ